MANHDMLFYGAVTKLETEETIVVEYRFTVNNMPIAIRLVVNRSNNDKTYDELFNEAVIYAATHYAMLSDKGGN